jgi:hypothetical protein
VGCSQGTWPGAADTLTSIHVVQAFAREDREDRRSDSESQISFAL